MPESKTIEIDEIVTPGKPQGDAPSSRNHRSGSASDSDTPNTDPFAHFQKSLPWKARITLKLTQWFMLLRSKSWGKWVIVPAGVLVILLAIPLGLIFFCVSLIRSFLKSFR